MKICILHLTKQKIILKLNKCISKRVCATMESQSFSGDESDCDISSETKISLFSSTNSNIKSSEMIYTDRKLYSSNYPSKVVSTITATKDLNKKKNAINYLDFEEQWEIEQEIPLSVAPLPILSDVKITQSESNQISRNKNKNQCLYQRSSTNLHYHNNKQI